MRTSVFYLLVFCVPLWGAERFSVRSGLSHTDKVLDLSDYGFLFDYPADWSRGDSNERCTIVYKKNYAQVNINHLKLPKEDMDLETFARRIQNTMDPPYRLKNDLGLRTINGKTFWVHELEKEETGNGRYSAFMTLSDKGYGLWIVCLYGEAKSKKKAIEIVSSIRESGQGQGTRREKQTKREHQYRIHTPVPGEDTPDVRSSPTHRTTTPPQFNDSRWSSNDPYESKWYKRGGRYTRFVPCAESGNFRGKVFLSDLGERQDYPVFLAFYRLARVTKKEPRYERSDFMAIGRPRFTATDHRGGYHIDLPEGFWRVEAYDRHGRTWPLLSGEEVFYTSKAKRFHHIKINNRDNKGE